MSWDQRTYCSNGHLHWRITSNLSMGTVPATFVFFLFGWLCVCVCVFKLFIITQRGKKPAAITLTTLCSYRDIHSNTLITLMHYLKYSWIILDCMYCNKRVTIVCNVKFCSVCRWCWGELSQENCGRLGGGEPGEVKGKCVDSIPSLEDVCVRCIDWTDHRWLMTYSTAFITALKTHLFKSYLC